MSVQESLTYDNDRIRIESLMIEELKNTINIIIDNPIPCVFLSEFNNYALIYELIIYTDKPKEFIKIQSNLRKNIFDIFKNNNGNMCVPYAQQTFDKQIIIEDKKMK